MAEGFSCGAENSRLFVKAKEEPVERLKNTIQKEN
jgi:hypothetical protein